MKKQEIENRFTYHRPNKDQIPKYEEIRAAAKLFASVVVCCCPESREKSLAITKIEEAVFWANAAIARNEQ